MNNKAILLLCVALVIAASVVLTNAVPPGIESKTQTNVLYNLKFDSYSTSGDAVEVVNFDEPKTVTLHSGGVSGGIHWANGGVPATAFVELCDEFAIPGSTDCYYVALPLYSEVSFEGIVRIGLHNTWYTTTGEFGAVQIASSVIYSYS